MSRRIQFHRHILLILLLLSCRSLFASPTTSPDPLNNPSITSHLREGIVRASMLEFSPDDPAGQIDDDPELLPSSHYLDYDDDPTALPSYRRPEVNDTNRNWWHLMRHGRLNTADTTVQYPKFLNFCMKVYRWADKTFNSYDTTYVVGTGRRWKIRLLSDNWVDSYYFNPGKKIPIRMMSDPYSNIGAYIQYMAVSLGYSVDINKMIGKSPSNHQKFEYTFNCARFNIEGHVWTNTGGTYIRTFGDYNNGHLIKEHFDGVRLKNIEAYGYYFFNNRKFSMGASYNFSKIQKRSAGSAVIGIGYNNIDVTMDFNLLPEELKPYLTVSPEKYRFHYRSYYLIGGYSFNWVITPKLLFNISALPGIGMTSTYANNYTGSAKSLAINARGMGSLTYNLKDFFICAVAKFYGSLYISGKNSMFSSVENGQLSIGYRF